LAGFSVFRGVLVAPQVSRRKLNDAKSGARQSEVFIARKTYPEALQQKATKPQLKGLVGQQDSTL